MRLFFQYIYIIFFNIISHSIYSQVADFDVPDNVCLDEVIPVSNLSTGIESYQWDFCANEFVNQGAEEILGSLGNVNRIRGLTIVYDTANAQYILFATDDSKNLLHRIVLGAELGQSFDHQEISFQSGSLSSPHDIDIVKNSDGNWLGYIGSATSGFGISRIEFGSSILNNTPSITNIGTLGEGSVQIRSAQIKKEGENYYLVGLSLNNNRFVTIDYGNSLINTPIDTLVTSSIAGMNLANGFDLVEYDNDVIAFVVGLTSKNIIRVNFGTTVFNDITYESTYDDSDFPSSIGRLSRILIQKNFDRYYAIVNQFDDSDPTLIIDLKDLDINKSPVDLQYSYTQFNDMAGGYYQGNFYYYGVNGSSIIRLSHRSDCGQNVGFGTDFSPLISYTQSGSYKINMMGVATNSDKFLATDTLTVISSQAPTISFDNSNICQTNPINYTSQNTSGDIVSYSWDFGDTNSSTEPNPSHSYVTAGSYEVTLDVTSSNGCGNFTKQTIIIYDEPVPDFTLPSGTICTNDEYTFVNNTTDNYEGNLTYDWQVNGQSVGTDRDLVYQFTSGGAKEIKLITSIPGCSIESIQNLSNVEVGAVPYFTSDDACMDTAIEFVNQSTGNIVSYNWDFGDANSSTFENPSYQYITAGTYDVVLTVTNTAGCETTYQQQVTAHAIPVASFSNDLACSGMSVSFVDESTVNNANIEEWEWTIEGGGSSSIQNPGFVFDEPGKYDVGLTVRSTFGCEATKLRTISVSESPVAIMDIDENCIGEAYTFTDVSTANTGGVIQSRFWSVDGIGYTTNTVNHIFNQAGEYEAILSITSDNLCTSVTTTIIQVDDAPEASFTVSSQCVGTPTVFVENTSSPNDDVESWYWDFAGLGNDNTSSPNFQFDQPGSYNVSLDIVTTKGCVSSMTQLVEINTSPVANFSTTQLYGPPPLSVDFTNQSTGATEYLWTYGDALGWGRDTDGSFTFEQEGAYAVRLTAYASDGCEATKEETIYVLTPSIDLAIDNVQLLDNEQYVLTISNQSNIPVDQFLLSIDLGSKVSLNELIDLPLVPGQSANHQIPFSIPSDDVDHICFKLMYEGDITESNLSNNEACITTSESNVILRAYPNPVNDIVVIPVIANAGDQLGVQLADVAGNVLLHNEYTLDTDGLNELVIDLALVRKGIYVLVLSSNNVNQTQRIFVE